MSATIAIDARPLADPSGEAFAYTLNLVHALAYVDSATRFHLFVDRDPDPAHLPRAANVAVTRIDAPARLWKASALPAAARAVDASLLHVQGLLPAAPAMPVVTTIRHLGPLLSPGLYPKATAWAWAALLPRQVRWAAAVIVPWQAVADQVRRLRIDPQRLAVIPYGVEPAFSPQCDSIVSYAAGRLGLTRPYVVGRSAPDGDPSAVVGVWNEARQHGLAAGLVLEADLDGFPTLKGLDPKAWPAVLSGAAATIIGDNDERAALSLLETMACGTPAVGPDCPVLREIAGNTAILGDSATMAAGLVHLAEPSDERTARMRGGLERAQRHTWPGMAEQTLAVYQRVAAAAERGHDGRAGER